jgi:hypothetical protein
MKELNGGTESGMRTKRWIQGPRDGIRSSIQIWKQEFDPDKESGVRFRIRRERKKGAEREEGNRRQIHTGSKRRRKNQGIVIGQLLWDLRV